MNVLKDGSLYAVADFESKEYSQTIQFIDKEKVDDRFVTVEDGTTAEELIEVLIHRLTFQHEKMNSYYTHEAIRYLENALKALKMRTADRERRGVEGTPNLWQKLLMVEIT